MIQAFAIILFVIGVALCASAMDWRDETTRFFAGIFVIVFAFCMPKRNC